MSFNPFGMRKARRRGKDFKRRIFLVGALPLLLISAITATIVYKTMAANNEETIGTVMSLKDADPNKTYGIMLYHDDCGRYFSLGENEALLVANGSDAVIGKNIELNTEIPQFSITYDDGRYYISNENKYLALQSDQLFSTEKTAVDITAEGYIKSSDGHYAVVSYAKGKHIISTTTDASKASNGYIMKISKQYDADTEITKGSIQPEKNFTAQIITTNEVYQDREFVIFAKDSNGQYVAINKEAKASAPIDVSELKNSALIKSSDTDVVWRINKKGSEGKRYFSSLANDLFLTTKYSNALGDSIDGSALQIINVDDTKLTAYIGDYDGNYLMFADGKIAVTDNRSEATVFSFARRFAASESATSDGVHSSIPKGRYLKVVSWSNVDKTGKKEYAILNATHYNTMHHVLGGDGRFISTPVTNVTNAFPEAWIYTGTGDPNTDDDNWVYNAYNDENNVGRGANKALDGFAWFDFKENDVLYTIAGEQTWTFTEENGRTQIKSENSGLYLEPNTTSAGSILPALSATKGQGVATEPVANTPLVYFGKNGEWLDILGFSLVTSTANRDARAAYVVAEVTEAADLPMTELPAGDEDTRYLDSVRSNWQKSSHYIATDNEDQYQIPPGIIMYPKAQDKSVNFDPKTVPYDLAYCVDVAHELKDNNDGDYSTVKKVAIGSYEPKKEGQQSFTNEQKQQLSAMIMHSYPFIPEFQFKDEMKKKGYDVEDITADEIIAGTQAALYKISDGQDWNYYLSDGNVHFDYEENRATEYISDTTKAEKAVNGVRDYLLSYATNAKNDTQSYGRGGLSSKSVKAPALAMSSQDNNKTIDLGGYKVVDVDIVSAGNYPESRLFDSNITIKLDRPVAQGDVVTLYGMYKGQKQSYGGSTAEYATFNPGESEATVTVNGERKSDLIEGMLYGEIYVALTATSIGESVYLYSPEYSDNQLTIGIERNFLEIDTQNIAVEKKWAPNDTFPESTPYVEVGLFKKGNNEPISRKFIGSHIPNNPITISKTYFENIPTKAYVSKVASFYPLNLEKTEVEGYFDDAYTVKELNAPSGFIGETSYRDGSLEETSVSGDIIRNVLIYNTVSGAPYDANANRYYYYDSSYNIDLVYSEEKDAYKLLKHGESDSQYYSGPYLKIVDGKAYLVCIWSSYPDGNFVYDYFWKDKNGNNNYSYNKPVPEAEVTIKRYHNPQFTVTNIPTKDIKVKRTWDDKGCPMARKKPKMTKINLMKDGQVVDTVKLDSTKTEATFRNVPIYEVVRDEQGNQSYREIEYTVQENGIDGYEKKIDNLEIVNCCKPSSTEESSNPQTNDHSVAIYFVLIGALCASLGLIAYKRHAI